VWKQDAGAAVRVHKLRNLERKAPKHALAEVKADFHGIVYAASEAAARKAHADFVSKWKSRCPGVVKSLEESRRRALHDVPLPEAALEKTSVRPT